MPHSHRVQRIVLGKTAYYKCMDSCNFRDLPEGMLGRTISCWSCSLPFKFKRPNLRQAKPRCGDSKCAVPKSPAAKAKAEMTKEAERKAVLSPAERILETMLGGQEEKDLRDIVSAKKVNIEPDESDEEVLARLGVDNKLIEDDGEEEDVEYRPTVASDELLRNLGIKNED